MRSHTLYSEDKFLQVKHIIERFTGREGMSDIDKKWSRKVTDVRHWFVFSAAECWQETQQEHERYSDSNGKNQGRQKKRAYTVLAARHAYQFGLELTDNRVALRKLTKKGIKKQISNNIDYIRAGNKHV